MEPGTLTHSIVTYAIAAAVPVVALALWLEYFKDFSFSEDENPRDPALSIEEHYQQDRLRLRGAHFFTLFAQAMIYIASAPLRAFAWLPCAILFAFFLILQSRVVDQCETELKDYFGIATPTVERERAQIAKRIIFWNIFSMLAYIGTVQIVALSFAVGTHLLGFPREAVVSMTLLGGLLGIAIGLALTFAFAPLQARKTLPIEPVLDPEFQALLSRWRNKILGENHPIESFIVKTQDDQWINAWVAGFTKAKGQFKPHLFFTHSLLKHFNLKEIETILLHELGHVYHDHLKKRFSKSILYLSISTFCLTALTLAGFAWLPTALLSAPLLASTALCIVVPMQKIKKLVENQEFEADYFVIKNLDGNITFYISVLEKLTRVHPSPVAHTAIHQRIARLKTLTSEGQREISQNDPSKAA
jgi:Zn-dependent protease with chaperone function